MESKAVKEAHSQHLKKFLSFTSPHKPTLQVACRDELSIDSNFPTASTCIDGSTCEYVSNVTLI
jgi:hypothetical protein